MQPTISKYFKITILFGVISAQISAQDVSAYKFLEHYLSQMTLADKVGQMCQYNLNFILKSNDSNDKTIEVDSNKLLEMVREFRVGSFLNTGGVALSIEEWNYVHNTINYFTTQEGVLPVLYGIDAVHGVNYTLDATLFPHQLGQAASWNDSLIEEASRATALESRVSGIPWVFSPILDAGRQPLWGQFFETFGEDPLLSSSLGIASIRGLQSIGNGERVAACAKHFVGYGVPVNGKDRTTVTISEHDLREKHLSPFVAAIREGVMSIMVGSHDINGIPMNANKYLLTDVLRDELGFKGVLLTDWGDVKNLHQIHHVTSDYKASVLKAIESGIDMAMIPEDIEFFKHLLHLVESEVISEDRLDESVRRILLMKRNLGLLDPVRSELSIACVGSEAHKNIAYQLASESITLLKNNEKLLPLKPSAKVLVAGKAMDDVRYQVGAWGRTWQGLDSIVMNEGIVSILSGIRAYASTAEDYKSRAGHHQYNISDIDVIILCLGERPSTEKPADITSLSISQDETELVKQLAALNKPMILVLSQNRPRLLGDIEELADAILLAYQPGAEGGKAIADILFGNVNPSGKLPFTYPKFEQGIGTYDHFATDEMDVNYGNEGFDPMWSFGHGLSYSEFTYSNLALDADTFSIGDSLRISVELENESNSDGKEVIQVYIRDEVASLVPPVRRLRAYEKIWLKANSSKIVELNIATDDLGFYHPNEKNKRVEEGWFRLYVNNEMVRFYLDVP